MLKDTNNITPESVGRDAYLITSLLSEPKSFSRCPYVKGSKERVAWAVGWNAEATEDEEIVKGYAK